MRMPSAKRLVSELSLTPSDARLIRRIGRSVDNQDDLGAALSSDPRLATLANDVVRDSCMNGMWRRTYALRAMDVILDTHGVESLGGAEYYGGPPYEYLNAGDAYVATLIFTTATDTVRIACWGDIAERMDRYTDRSDR